MITIDTVRTAVNTLLDTVEWRILGVINAVEEAAKGLIVVITTTVGSAATQIVDIAFDLTRTVMISAFDVAGSVVDAALGEKQEEDN